MADSSLFLRRSWSAGARPGTDISSPPISLSEKSTWGLPTKATEMAPKHGH